MKLEAIKRVCKHDGEYVIFNQDNAQQWIGTTNACYEVQHVRLNQESICALLDVDLWENDEDVREERFEFSALYPRHDIAPVDLQAMIGIRDNGSIMRIFSDGKRVYMVNDVFIKPAINKTSSYITFKVTENEAGDPLILIGDGMLTTAIIRPESAGATDVIVNAMQNIVAIYGRKDQEENT